MTEKTTGRATFEMDLGGDQVRGAYDLETGSLQIYSLLHDDFGQPYWFLSFTTETRLNNTRTPERILARLLVLAALEEVSPDKT